MLDYAVLGILLVAMLAVGAWAGRKQSTSDEFFLANRSLAWWPLGMSLAVAAMAAVYYCGIPNEACWAGLKFILVPALVWAALPIVFWCVIPLYGNLELDSVYEYLELRYSPGVRSVAAGLILVGMLFWLGGALVLPCRALQPDAGLSFSVLFLLVAVAGVTTLYTFLGGMKATVWTDVAQLILMVVGLGVLLLAVASALDKQGGIGGIWEIAERLGRTKIVEPPHEWSAPWTDWAAQWSVWATVPYLALISIFFFTADQTTLQRLFAARDDQDMKLAYLLGCGLFSLMVPVVMYVGMGVMAVYHENAQAEIRPHWVANVAKDPVTEEPLIEPGTVIDAENVEELAAEGAILDPNTNRPFEDTAELIRTRGNLEEVRIDRLATRATRKRGGQRWLRAGGERLFASFVERHLRFGLAGVVLAALAAAAMATLDSALNSLATLVVIDFHRRQGWAENWLARQCGKEPKDLDQTDELRLGRPVVLILGAAVLVIALIVAELCGSVFGYLLGVLNLFAGPLLGVFLLGLFTRRTTAAAAMAGLVLGILTALWATFGHLAKGTSLWPFGEAPLGPFWPLLLGLGATLAVGCVLSFLIGSRKSRDELSGLVVGLGRLGILLEIEGEEDDEVYLIDISDES